MVRAATVQDLPRVMAIYDTARRYMRANGNTVQWVNGYPSEALLRQDIRDGTCCTSWRTRAACMPCLRSSSGDDPTYGRIEGAWRDESPYGTIHRLGSDGTHRGVFAETAAWAARQCPHLRADTHAANLTMRHCMEQAGFVYCGVIYVADGTPRVAYEKV